MPGCDMNGAGCAGRAPGWAAGWAQQHRLSRQCRPHSSAHAAAPPAPPHPAPACPTQTLDGHAHNISTVCFHPELPLILTGSEDGTVKLWHSTT